MFFSLAAQVAALALTLTVRGVAGHTTVWSVWVDGVDQGDGRGKYIRSPPNNSPIKQLGSPEVSCNVNGGTEVPTFVQAKAGSKITFEWYHNTRGDDIVASSHLGAMIAHIATYPDQKTNPKAVGPIWTKIAEDGYDGTTKKWASDKLIANKGKYTFSLPADLAPGKYLVRNELPALHEADALYSKNPARGIQLYPSCVQFQITGTGTGVPKQNFDFQTGYTDTTPGIFFNVYSGGFSTYPIPGPPAVTTLGGGAGSTPATPPQTPGSANTTSTPTVSQNGSCARRLKKRTEFVA